MNESPPVRVTGVTLADVSGGALRVLHARHESAGTLRVSDVAVAVTATTGAPEHAVELPLAWVDGAHGRPRRGWLSPGLLILDAEDPATAQRLSLAVTVRRGVDAVALAERVAAAALSARGDPERSRSGNMHDTRRP